MVSFLVSSVLCLQGPLGRVVYSSSGKKLQAILQSPKHMPIM